MSLSQPSSSGKTGVRGRYIALFLRVETFHPHPPALLLAQQPQLLPRIQCDCPGFSSLVCMDGH